MASTTSSSTQTKRTPRPRAKGPRETRGEKDAIALLKGDHRDIEALFKSFEGLGPRAHKSRQSTMHEILEMLAVHAVIEEMAFYPAIRERIPEAEEEALEALEEHHVVKLLAAELERMRSEDERFHAKATVMMEIVRHHLEEEEQELFPKVRKEFSRAELEEMGSLLANAKHVAPTRPHPHVPDTPPANIVAAALSAPLDAAARVALSAVDKARDIVR